MSVATLKIQFTKASLSNLHQIKPFHRFLETAKIYSKIFKRDINICHEAHQTAKVAQPLSMTYDQDIAPKDVLQRAWAPSLQTLSSPRSRTDMHIAMNIPIIDRKRVIAIRKKSHECTECPKRPRNEAYNLYPTNMGTCK